MRARQAGDAWSFANCLSNLPSLVREDPCESCQIGREQCVASGQWDGVRRMVGQWGGTERRKGGEVLTQHCSQTGQTARAAKHGRPLACHERGGQNVGARTLKLDNQ